MRRSGFTLIELLVVVAIISLLLAILLPSFKRARAQANEVVCRSNLHQIQLSLEMYAQNNRSWYPLEPFECNPHPGLIDTLKAEDKSGLINAMYCPQADLVERAAQNATDYPPTGVTTSVIDTPENREVGNISYLYWSFKDRSVWRSPGKWKDDMDSFRPRWLRNSYSPLPLPASKNGDGQEPWASTPVDLQRNRPGGYWVMSDFFRKQADFPHTRKHKSGLNVLYLDGHADWMYGQPRANFK